MLLPKHDALEEAIELFNDGHCAEAGRVLWKERREAFERHETERLDEIYRLASEMRNLLERDERSAEFEAAYGKQNPPTSGVEAQGETRRSASSSAPHQSETPSSGSGDAQTNQVANPSAGSFGTPRPSLLWAYGWAGVVARLAIMASILSVIGGIVLGIVLSKYTTADSFGIARTAHHGGVVVYWIVGGVLGAALWMALAVGLELLADVGKSLREMRSIGLP